MDEKNIQAKPEDTTPEFVKKAEDVAKALKAENDRTEQLAKRMEEAKAREILGGKSTGGQTQTPKVETAKEYADRVMKNQVPTRKE